MYELTGVIGEIEFVVLYTEGGRFLFQGLPKQRIVMGEGASYERELILRFLVGLAQE